MPRCLKTKLEFANLAGVSATSITRQIKTSLKDAVIGGRIDINHPSAKEYIEKTKLSKKKPSENGQDPRYDEAVNYCKRKGSYTVATIRELGFGSGRAGKILKMMKVAGIVPKKGTAKPQPEIEAKSQAEILAEAREQDDIEEEVYFYEEPEKPKKKAAGWKARSENKKQAARSSVKRGNDGLPEDHAIEEFKDWTLDEIIQRFGSDTEYKDYLDARKKITEIKANDLKNAEKEGKLISREIVSHYIIDRFEECHRRLLTDVAQSLSVKVETMVKSGCLVTEIQNEISKGMSSIIRPTKDKVARTLRDI
jgi:hypothetical protein